MVSLSSFLRNFLYLGPAPQSFRGEMLRKSLWKSHRKSLQILLECYLWVLCLILVARRGVYALKKIKLWMQTQRYLINMQDDTRLQKDSFFSFGPRAHSKHCEWQLSETLQHTHAGWISCWGQNRPLLHPMWDYAGVALMLLVNIFPFVFNTLVGEVTQRSYNVCITTFETSHIFGHA